MNAEKILEIAGKASTWKGIIGIATALGVTISPELTTHIIAVGMGLVGIINLVRTEKKQ